MGKYIDIAMLMAIGFGALYLHRLGFFGAIGNMFSGITDMLQSAFPSDNGTGGSTTPSTPPYSWQALFSGIPGMQGWGLSSWHNWAEQQTSPTISTSPTATMQQRMMLCPLKYNPAKYPAQYQMCLAGALLPW